MIRTLAAALATSTCIVALATPAAAQTREYNIPAGSLKSALDAYVRQSGRQVVYRADQVRSARSPGTRGQQSAEAALAAILSGSGFITRTDGNLVAIVREGNGLDGPGMAREVSSGDEILVTGSRIRGAQLYSPTISVSRETLEAAGQTNLGDAVRTIPQNFGGGQSPYIGLGAEDYGSDNLNSGSSINLRGLGPDATLTLLNGRRLAYDGVFEGVDVASIPLAAIDRIEVVADGASAIYGSDAVAGVANVILRRNYSGFETSARLGSATDGGDLQQQYQAVGGGKWSSGGVVATLSYDHASAVTADQRSFSRQLDRTTTIVPQTEQLSAVTSAHQQLTSRVEANLDLLWSRRNSRSTYPNRTPGTYLDSGIERAPRSTSFGLSPSLTIALSKSWSATLNATYARDQIQGGSRFFLAGAVIADYGVKYTNQSASGEASAEGVLASLPGGEARLALGMGYRRVDLSSERLGGGTEAFSFKGARDSYYGFGELNVPLIGRDNQRAGVSLLSFNVAGRFERYPQIGSVFTPKIGVLYAPTKFLKLHATWGRSFKAPTLEQLYGPQNGLLYTADLFGGVGNPPTATALYVYGGNAQLTPQRATNWSAGATFSPFEDRRLTVEATWFRTRYTDRIVAPITSPYTALSDPRVAPLIRFSPNESEVSGAISALTTDLANYSGYTFAPAAVVAIIDNRYNNVSVEKAQGVDLAINGQLRLAHDATLSLNASGTYLTSNRRVSAGQDLIQLAGTIFSPTHFRARGGASLQAGRFTSGVYATYTGSVVDDRYIPEERVDSQTSVDLSFGYSFAQDSGLLKGVSTQATILNLLNDLPARIRTANAIYTPFDTTNYNPVGRLISLTVTKKW